MPRKHILVDRFEVRTIGLAITTYVINPTIESEQVALIGKNHHRCP